jgi:hypothetical protein
MEIPKGHKMGWITYASFTDKKIISQGFDFEKVYKEALDKGVKHPIIIAAPIKIKEVKE